MHICRSGDRKGIGDGPLHGGHHGAVVGLFLGGFVQCSMFMVETFWFGKEMILPHQFKRVFLNICLKSP